ncbi:uncharacterized protein PAN0_021d6053 [Moesziomyces antarcticus]|uniref:Uncharacterized protein n=1 Tax=Pseudozyma antarctica TaxID=84753 RepID=A0A081CMC8_PSEA2|nr:uncharacterized protein PAN0_021d6053 [Moesziomyces antarcticus]GAK67824.1 hypothetical protein PAN0_021d6053 [Moesziomyces antarcticus]
MFRTAACYLRTSLRFAYNYGLVTTHLSIPTMASPTVAEYGRAIAIASMAAQQASPEARALANSNQAVHHHIMEMSFLLAGGPFDVDEAATYVAEEMNRFVAAIDAQQSNDS